MKAIDFLGHLGHRVHLARGREARMLFGWLGDLQGRSLLDVGGGDGYWASRARLKGAFAVSLDIDPRRTERGRSYSERPELVRGDALRLPFADGSFDRVMSISSIEHFPFAADSMAEMARVLKPGGELALSADSLAGGERWPGLARAHMNRYSVIRPLDHVVLAEHMRAAGLEPVRFAYLFKSRWANRLYLEVSRNRWAWNAAAPLSPVVALADKRNPCASGSIVLMHARRQSSQGGPDSL